MKIQLAANFSRPMLELLAERKIRLNYLKLSMAEAAEEQLAASRPYLPNLLHFMPNLGQPAAFWQTYDFATLNRWAADAKTPHLSIHLDAYRSDLKTELTREELLSLLLKNYRYVQERVGLPLLVENCDQEPDWVSNGQLGRFQDLCRAEVVSEFLERSGSKLLLDVAHARCSAFWLKVAPEEYLAQLPLARVQEIHTNGPRMIKGEMIDAHQDMQEADFVLMAWVLPRCQSKIVTLEYGGVGERYERDERNNKEKLCAQLKRLQALAGLV